MRKSGDGSVRSLILLVDMYISHCSFLKNSFSDNATVPILVALHSGTLLSILAVGTLFFVFNTIYFLAKTGTPRDIIPFCLSSSR